MSQKNDTSKSESQKDASKNAESEDFHERTTRKKSLTDLEEAYVSFTESVHGNASPKRHKTEFEYSLSEASSDPSAKQPPAEKAKSEAKKNPSAFDGPGRDKTEVDMSKKQGIDSEKKNRSIDASKPSEKSASQSSKAPNQRSDDSQKKNNLFDADSFSEGLAGDTALQNPDEFEDLISRKGFNIPEIPMKTRIVDLVRGVPKYLNGYEKIIPALIVCVIFLTWVVLDRSFRNPSSTGPELSRSLLEAFEAEQNEDHSQALRKLIEASMIEEHEENRSLLMRLIEAQTQKSVEKSRPIQNKSGSRR